MKIILLISISVFSVCLFLFLQKKEINSYQPKIQIPLIPIRPKEEKKEMINPKKVKKIVVYDFWANWCPPCRTFAPKFESWKNKYSTDNITFVKVNIEDDPSKASEYNISSIPTVVVTVDNVEVKRWTGAPLEADLLEYLK